MPEMTEPLQQGFKELPRKGRNTGQELVPSSMNFWGEVIGIAGSHGAQDTFPALKVSVLAHLEVHGVHPEDVSVQLAELGQSPSDVINVLHSFPDGIHHLGAMATELS
ncbi:hypothetical protein IHE44_0004310 [Lamprotornis superbus]|uniref:Uncharacterized protein n=1 Tax=Lamprotornis superbus TaxID=245042 RepID=A0A835NN68_9PASS|nr:hypothetical protein IHE44_0004310 [Lamprotornis superbus]